MYLLDSELLAAPIYSRSCILLHTHTKKHTHIHTFLQGKPYAYTPFCNNNKEMDEFRFWKGGFWSQHLRVRALTCNN